MAHSMGEVQLHREDANILGAGVSGVGSIAVNVDTVNTVSVDTVGKSHFWREIKQRGGVGWERGG